MYCFGASIVECEQVNAGYNGGNIDLKLFNFKFTFFLDINIQGADGAQPIHFAARYFKAQKHIATTDHPVKEVLPLIDAEESFGKIKTLAQSFRERFWRSTSLILFNYFFLVLGQTIEIKFS